MLPIWVIKVEISTIPANELEVIIASTKTYRFFGLYTRVCPGAVTVDGVCSMRMIFSQSRRRSITSRSACVRFPPAVSTRRYCAPNTRSRSGATSETQ